MGECVDERRGAGRGPERAGHLGLEEEEGWSKREVAREKTQQPKEEGVESKRDGSRKTRMLKHLWDLAVSGDWTSVVAGTWRQADFGGSQSS